MNQDDKCTPIGMCFHGPEDHKGGACWKITQPQLENEPTIDKYCACIAAGNTRLFADMGFMQVQELGDRMITKICRGCGDAVNLLITEEFCMRCKDKPEYWKNEIPTLEPHGEWIKSTIVSK
jgi:hypothetical protein